MRNLKKILALVLALVMSLSLMATASAAETTSASADPYLQAEEVLKGLLVYQGSSTGYRFEDNITRAETAALVYRVATGDVLNEQAGIYTNHPFTDLSESQKVWANGYISYCYNAEIIKGTGAGKFSPSSNVTGHQILAMVLRAMGYGKNHEFEGKGWEIQTAATARSVGLLNGVTAADDARLGQPATRGLVSQIIFNALMNDKVHFQSNTPYNYVSDGITLGQEQFGLEEITGVIRSNEWANLDGNSVLDEGKTVMTVTEVRPDNTHKVATVGKDITLEVSTALEDVGLREKAYMHGTGSTKTVIQSLSSEGLNTVADNEGKGVATGLANEGFTSIEKLADTQGLKAALNKDDTEYYINYDQVKDATIAYYSDWVIRYAIAVESVNANPTWKAYFDAKLDAAGRPTDSNLEIRNINVTYTDANGDAQKKTVQCYVLRIQPGNYIYIDSGYGSTVDWQIITEIFETADRVGDNTIDATGALRDYVIGEVYAGTSSMEDRSDNMSQPEFVSKFLDKTLTAYGYLMCRTGDTLRIIDNKVDPIRVLRVDHVQTKAVDLYKDELAFNGTSSLDGGLHVQSREYPGLRMADYTGKNLYNPDGLSKDDLNVIANYTIIDGKLSIWKAEVVTDTINSKSYKDLTVTTSESDETLGQSGILNFTRLDQNNQMMAEKVLYNIYLDTYRNVRSYELANGPAYALLTEMYPANNQNFTYVKDYRQIAEMQVKDGDVAEYYVVKGSQNLFFSDYVWTSRVQGKNLPTTLLNYLQPATAHLGIGASELPNYNRATGKNVYFDVEGAVGGAAIPYSTMVNGVLTFNDAWNRNVYPVLTDGTAPAEVGMYTPGVFQWGAAKDYNGTPADPTDDERDYSFTNVAKYVMQDEEVILTSASELYRNERTGVYEYRATAALYGENLYVKHSADEWKSIYSANKTAADDAAYANADAWFQAMINAGTLYIVYASDYVQLATGANMKNSNSTHFTVANTYNANYKALANAYVNTTDNTEFYVVTPTDIIYKQGYVDFNTVSFDVNDVRAAYAVAKNTSAQNNGQDYWVADVVVIEVDGLTSSWESLALMYYNPYETSGQTQYVNGLENYWHALQPNYEKNAMTEIVPKNYSTWQNHSWDEIDYGFYKLYDQDLVADGQLTAGDAKQVQQGEYNKLGIYAGTVVRENVVLDDGRYVDIRRPGIDKVNNNAGDAHDVQVRYADWSTPVYRLERDQYGRTTANQINLTDWDVTNSLNNGDRVIYALDKDGNCAYIVDLGGNAGTRSHSGAILAPDWYNPQWLVRVYNEIVAEQENTWGDATTVLNYYNELITAINNGEPQTASGKDVTWAYVQQVLSALKQIKSDKSYDTPQEGVAVDNAITALEGVSEDAVNLVQALNKDYNDLVNVTIPKLAKDAAKGNAAVEAKVVTALTDKLDTDYKDTLLAQTSEAAGDSYVTGTVIPALTAAATTAANDARDEIAEESKITSVPGSAVETEYVDNIDTTVGDTPVTDVASFKTTFPAGQKVSGEYKLTTELEVEDGYHPALADDAVLPTGVTSVDFELAPVKATNTWIMTVTVTPDFYTNGTDASAGLKVALVIEGIVAVPGGGASGAGDPVTITVSSDGMTVETIDGEEVALTVGEYLPEKIVLQAPGVTLTNTASNYVIQMVGTESTITPSNVALSNNNSTATLTLPMAEVTGNINIVLRSTAKTPATITGTDITADPDTTYVDDLLDKITVTSAVTGKVVTAVTQVKNGETTLTSGNSDYTFDAATGEIDFSGTGITVAGDIEITATLTASYAVTSTVDPAGTATVTAPAEVAAATGVTEIPGLTITPVAGNVVKEVAITIGGTAVAGATYNAGTKKVSFTSDDIDGAVAITVTTEKEYTVSAGANYEVDKTTVTATEAESSVTVNVTAKAGSGAAIAKYDTVAVQVGETTLVEDTDYTASATANDKIAITINADKIDGNVTITVTPEATYTVGLSTADAANFTVSPATVSETDATDGAVTITLTAKDGVEVKSGDTVTVTVGGSALDAAKITSTTPSTGTGTSASIAVVLAQGAITGDVEITVVPDPN